MITYCPILINGFTPKLIMEISLILDEETYYPEEYIFHENDMTNQNLFFI